MFACRAPTEEPSYAGYHLAYEVKKLMYANISFYITVLLYPFSFLCLLFVVVRPSPPPFPQIYFIWLCSIYNFPSGWLWNVLPLLELFGVGKPKTTLSIWNDLVLQILHSILQDFILLLLAVGTIPSLLVYLSLS